MSEWQAVMRSGGITIRRLPSAPSRRAAGDTLVQDLIQALGRHVRSAWTWLERRRSAHFAARRLHVTETLSLGEKRFVSIIEVDGTQYLIGGSAENVQLLTRLEAHEAMGLPHGAESEVRS